MTLGDELRELAGELAGAGWRRKLPQEWTPEEEAAYHRAPDEESLAWLDWAMHEPMTLVYDEHHRLIRIEHNGVLISEYSHPPPDPEWERQIARWEDELRGPD